MTMGRVITVSLLVLAVVAGGASWSQRQASAVLRGEIELLREENAELARLRAENKRLNAQQVSAAEQERLRGDHVAVMRLRDEVEKSKEGLRLRERALAEKSVPALATGLKPMESFTNVGKATARAALETWMWAAHGGDTAVMADAMALSPESRQKAEELFARVPETVRVQYGTPEQLLAAAFAGASGMQTTGMQVLSEQAGARIDGMDPVLRSDAAYKTLHVQNQYANGSVREMDLVFQQTAEGWKQVIQPNTVIKAAALLGKKLAPASQPGGE